MQLCFSTSRNRNTSIFCSIVYFFLLSQSLFFNLSELTSSKRTLDQADLCPFFLNYFVYLLYSVKRPLIAEARVVNRISTTNMISEGLVSLSTLPNVGIPFDRIHFFFGNLFHKVLFKNKVIDTRKKAVMKRSCCSPKSQKRNSKQ